VFGAQGVAISLAPFAKLSGWFGNAGVLCAIGAQRFGNDGRNVAKAAAMFRGEFTPGDRLLRGLLLSAARSHLFNAVVAGRMSRGNWDRPQAGEVFGFADNGTILLPEKQRGDEAARFEQGVVELTAPLWGNGELQSVAAVSELETALLAGFPRTHRRTRSLWTAARAPCHAPAAAATGVGRAGEWRSAISVRPAQEHLRHDLAARAGGAGCTGMRGGAASVPLRHGAHSCPPFAVRRSPFAKPYQGTDTLFYPPD